MWKRWHFHPLVLTAVLGAGAPAEAQRAVSAFSERVRTVVVAVPVPNSAWRAEGVAPVRVVGVDRGRAQGRQVALALDVPVGVRPGVRILAWVVAGPDSVPVMGQVAVSRGVRVLGPGPLMLTSGRGDSAVFVIHNYGNVPERLRLDVDASPGVQLGGTPRVVGVAPGDRRRLVVALRADRRTEGNASRVRVRAAADTVEGQAFLALHIVPPVANPAVPVSVAVMSGGEQPTQVNVSSDLRVANSRVRVRAGTRNQYFLPSGLWQREPRGLFVDAPTWAVGVGEIGGQYWTSLLPSVYGTGARGQIGDRSSRWIAGFAAAEPRFGRGAAYQGRVGYRLGGTRAEFRGGNAASSLGGSGHRSAGFALSDTAALSRYGFEGGGVWTPSGFEGWAGSGRLSHTGTRFSFFGSADRRAIQVLGGTGWQSYLFASGGAELGEGWHLLASADRTIRDGGGLVSRDATALRVAVRVPLLLPVRMSLGGAVHSVSLGTRELRAVDASSNLAMRVRRGLDTELRAIVSVPIASDDASPRAGVLGLLRTNGPLGTAGLEASVGTLHPSLQYRGQVGHVRGAAWGEMARGRLRGTARLSTERLAGRTDLTASGSLAWRVITTQEVVVGVERSAYRAGGRPQLHVGIRSVLGLPFPGLPDGSGLVFEDANADGRRDRDDVPVPGVQVSRAGVSVYTDASGRFSLPAGSDLQVDVPAGYRLRSVARDRVSLVRVGALRALVRFAEVDVADLERFPGGSLRLFSESKGEESLVPLDGGAVLITGLEPGWYAVAHQAPAAARRPYVTEPVRIWVAPGGEAFTEIIASYLPGRLRVATLQSGRAPEPAPAPIPTLQPLPPLLPGQRRVLGTPIVCGADGGPNDRPAAGVEILEATVYFGTAGDMLDAVGRAGLDRLLAQFCALPQGAVFRIAGHTDNVGSEATNQRLSERRAHAVASYLVEQGVQQERMRVRGAGEASPVMTNATVAGRARNRRAVVELVVTDR